MNHSFIRHLHVALIATLLVAVVGMIAPAQPAYAASVVVNSNLDTTGTCSTLGTGTCTLRDAIAYANANSGSVITFASNYTITPTAVGDTTAGPSSFGIYTTVTMSGSGTGGVTINGGNTQRLFYVSSTGDLTLDSLTLTGGLAQGGAGGSGGVDLGSGGGGGGGLGGAIFNQGTLTIQNSTLSGNTARGGDGGDISIGTGETGSGGGGGGGFAGAGGLGGDAGGIGSGGGGGGTVGNGQPGVSLGNGGSGGTGGSGGVAGGTSYFGSGGSAPGAGGGGGAPGSGTGGTGGSGGTGGFGGGGGGGGGADTGGNGGSGGFGGGGGAGAGTRGNGGDGGFAGGGGGAGNQGGSAGSGGFGAGQGGSTGDPGFGGGGGGGGGGFGGAIYNDNASTLIITNSTLSGNTAQGGSGKGSGTNGQGLGGALFNRNGSVTLTNSTIVNNTADGGGLYNDAGTTSLANTLVAGNTPSGSHDLAGSFFDGGYNLIGDGSGSTGITNGTNGNIVGTSASPINPMLGALANNGGPTQTLALLSGSPAIDKGNDTVCANSPVNNLDQRGVTRPRGFHCDIGAYELIIVPAPKVNQAAGQSDPTSTSPIHFTAVFNEPINTSTFTASDVTLGGTAGGTTAVVTQIAPNDGSTFDIAVSGMTGLGTVTVSIRANAVQDSFGTPNIASTSTDNIVTFGHELLTNGGFNLYTGTSKVPQSWNAQNFSVTDGKNTTKADVEEGSAAVQIASHSPSLTKNLFQVIMLNGLQADKFIFSFWVKGSAIPITRSCMGQVLFYKNNPRTGPGTPYLLVGTQTVPCPTGTFAYMQETLSFLAPAAYNRIVVQFGYSAAAGMVWFDKASLLK